MKRIIYIITILSSMVLLSSCEDKIDVKLDGGKEQLAVDAFITDVPGNQRIRLVKTLPYFENEKGYESITNASVSVTDLNNGKVFSFVYSNDGYYDWTSGISDTFGVIGHQYQLSIKWDGDEYVSVATLHPTVPVDTITYEFLEVGEFGGKKGYYAEFDAKDRAPVGSYYWIRSYRNGKFNNYPEMLTLSADGVGQVTGQDTNRFIPPLRQAITRGETPYIKGDQVKVEIWSLDENGFNILALTQLQINNTGLFASPATNVPTNITNTTNKDKKCVGLFQVCSVSSRSVTIE